MARTKPKVVVTRKLPDVVETRMMELFDVHMNVDDHLFSREELKRAVAECDVLVPNLTDLIDKSVLENSGTRLKLIANFGNGVDHIDLAVAQAHNITVTNTPDVLTEDTADMTMALMVAVPRRLIEGAQIIRKGEFKGWSPTHMLGHRLHGKRLGIIGMGRIGAAVARRARGFGMAIHYHNRRRLHPELEAEVEATYWESLDQMLARMDVISVHCPHTPATFHLLSERRLKLMKPTAYLVNLARGEVVDEDALITLLKRGKLAGAGLDVFEHEPAVNSEFMSLKNVILLPHMGSATIEGRISMGEKVIINIRAFSDGHQPPDRVLPPQG
ncbi:MAG TPA: D-glycerate dehydrogenase [Rhodospirillaceae bacterium]|nr:D-glycerate dehydrogenase [Candidatus Neomarinimicrobiota bacterium]HCX14372.1 D-glycerate dehydrogenase [Rhodospirillaceae bacterium]